MSSLQSKRLAALVLQLRDLLGARVFVETGTFTGATTRWAARHFEAVQSVELSPLLCERARTALSDLVNVSVACGDSAQFLKDCAEHMDHPAIFWLDAHWSGGETANPDTECPVLEEVAAINSSHAPHVILIDDARYFLRPPPLPHDRTMWPGLSELLGALGCSTPRYVVVVEDVVVAVPIQASDLVADFCQQVAAEDVEDDLSQAGPEGMLGRPPKRLHRLRRMVSRPVRR